MNAQSTATDFSLTNVSNVDGMLHTPTTSHSYWSFGSYADPDGTIVLNVVTGGIVMPVIGFIGIITNALNMAVLSKVKKLKRVPIYEILLSMTAADLAIAVCVFVHSGIYFMRPSPVILFLKNQKLNKVEYYTYFASSVIENLCKFISHWNTTSVAAFRFIAVYFPLRAAQWCTPRLTRATIASTIIAALLVSPLLFNLMHFVPLIGSYAYEVGIFFITITIFVPWILSVVLVSLLLASLRSRPVDGLATRQSRDRMQVEQRQLTVLLTFTAAWFVVTTLPIAMYNVIYKLFYPYSSDTKVQFVRWQEVAYIMLLLNYCGNFFFYSWINKCHRKQLRELISSCTRK